MQEFSAWLRLRVSIIGDGSSPIANDDTRVRVHWSPLKTTLMLTTATLDRVRRSRTAETH
jgi:hypothetical protein